MAESGSESINDVSIEAEVGVEEVMAATDDKPLLDDIWQCERIETFHELRETNGVPHYAMPSLP